MAYTRSLQLLVALSLTMTACSLDRTGLGADDGGPEARDANVDSSISDASIDASELDGGPDEDGGPVDAGLEDGGLDGGQDDGGLDGGQDGGGVDGGQDGGLDGGLDGGQDGGPAPCTAAANSCTGGTAQICNVATGALEARTCSALGCNAAATACAVLLPSNVAPTLFDGAASAWNVAADASYDTDACTGGTMVTPASGRPLCVRRVSALSVATGVTLSVVGAHPLVVLSQGDAVISGTIDLSARGWSPRAGGGIGGLRGATDGVGLHPGLHGDTDGSYNDGGGGGGGFCGDGGDGGDGEGSANGGVGGGIEASTYALEPLTGGSGGGWARGASGTGFDSAARGGGGGGAIQISARGTITITGAILAAGGGGEGGGATTDFNTNYGAGGGGGSGGGILLEAATITVAATARVWTTGGGGGGSADGEAASGADIARPGAPGQDGRLTGERAAGGAEGGPAYGANGGDSGGGSTNAGGNGENNTSRTGSNGGGGGGGVGCIVLRTGTGDRPADRSPFSAETTVGLRGVVAYHD